jgi:hypothetical protein
MLEKHFLPYRKYCISIRTTNKLTLFGEIKFVCSENPMKDMKTVCGQNTELLNYIAAGSYTVITAN